MLKAERQLRVRVRLVKIRLLLLFHPSVFTRLWEHSLIYPPVLFIPKVLLHALTEYMSRSLGRKTKDGNVSSLKGCEENRAPRYDCSSRYVADTYLTCSRDHIHVQWSEQHSEKENITGVTQAFPQSSSPWLLTEICFSLYVDELIQNGLFSVPSVVTVLLSHVSVFLQLVSIHCHSCIVSIKWI